jgi:Ca2+-dependent lipid-binding protein
VSAGAKKLKVADMFSSDPYVDFHYMDVPYKTKTVFKSLNPTW